MVRSPPESATVVIGDEFDSPVVLGNAGGAAISGVVSVELVAPTAGEAVHTATIVVRADDDSPSGAAMVVTVGSVDSTVAGEWHLSPGSEIDCVHPHSHLVVTEHEHAILEIDSWHTAGSGNECDESPDRPAGLRTVWT